MGRICVCLGGRIQRVNATAAAALAANYGIAKDSIAEGLRSFRSVKRRLEVKAEIHGITIIDDFAHHPTAIAQTLKAVRTRYPGRRLWAILEPRSNTLRRKVFQHELAGSLAVADKVVVAAIFKSEAIPEDERLDAAAVIAVTASVGHAGLLARYMQTRLSKPLALSCAPEMWSPSCRTGDSAESTRSCLRNSESLHEVSTPA